MGERVNIQYSVDIDDLGEEVCRLICDAFENLNRAAGRSAPPEDNVLSLQTIQQIDEIRQQLGEIDTRLGDAVNIINGYVLYQSDLINQQQVGAQADEQIREHDAQSVDPSSATDSLLNLQQQLAQFQNEDELST
jgi:hypothetical protein